MSPYRIAVNTVQVPTGLDLWCCRVFGHKMSVAHIAASVFTRPRCTTLRTTCPRCLTWVSPLKPYVLAPGIDIAPLALVAFHTDAEGIHGSIYVRYGERTYYVGMLPGNTVSLSDSGK